MNSTNHRELLKEEGLTDEQITYEEDIKFENELGFFSYKIVRGYPFLTHFYLKKDKRDGFNFIKLYHAFRREIVRAGYVDFIAEVPPGKEYFGKFIEGCLGCPEPYVESNGSKFYLVRVRYT